MRIRSRVAAAAIGLVVMVAGSLVAASPAQAYPGAVNGCGGGNACLYNGPGWTYTITNSVAFGWENVFNMFGTKRYLNNQSAGWWAYLCTGSGGTGTCDGWIQILPYSWHDLDFTPINSIKVGT